MGNQQSNFHEEVRNPEWAGEDASDSPTAETPAEAGLASGGQQPAGGQSGAESGGKSGAAEGDGDPIVAQAAEQEAAKDQVPDLGAGVRDAQPPASDEAAGPAERADKETGDDRGLTTNTSSSE